MSKKNGSIVLKVDENEYFDNDSDNESLQSEKSFDFENGKPMTTWLDEDFPNKPDLTSHGFNKILDGYSSLRKYVFKNKVEYEEDVKPVSCDGISGLCTLIILLSLDVAFVAYAIYCRRLETEDDIRLIWLSAVCWFVILLKILRRLIRLGRYRGGCFTPFAVLGDGIHKAWSATLRLLAKPWNACWNRIETNEKAARKKKRLTIKIITITLMLIFCLLCLIFFVILQDVRNLVSLSGMLLLVLISISISWHPGKILWQPVLGGIFIQLVFAVLTLRTQPGYVAFQFLGDRMAEFLDHSFAGSTFVFGDLSCFAFNVLPVVVFFSSFISILFHLGIINLLIDKPSIVAKKLLKTTGPETLNAVANIFVSMTESPLITRPYMHMMTCSELHSIIVNGFASVAGSVLAAYISFGVPANHLLIACVMSAPAALAISKIIYPETKRAPLAALKSMSSIKSPYSNVLEAAMVGAMESVPICAGIASNLIAFLSIYGFFNKTLTWLGKRACLTVDLTFELIFSYILWPIAFTMGIPTEDCLKVAELIGVKSMLNEFVAFERLGIIILDSETFQNRDLNVPVNILSNGSWIVSLQNSSSVLFQYGAFYTNRAEVITTYALCGFANIGSIGIMLGAMVTMLPHRRQELSRMVLGGMIGGTAACFMTGCFAGLLYEAA